LDFRRVRRAVHGGVFLLIQVRRKD
jgi:hypothetical protein